MAGTNVLVARLTLPGLLMGVQRSLLGFLAALDAWTARIGLEGRGGALVEAVLVMDET